MWLLSKGPKNNQNAPGEGPPARDSLRASLGRTTGEETKSCDLPSAEPAGTPDDNKPRLDDSNPRHRPTAISPSKSRRVQPR
jgi:hypothetical protein